MRNALRAGLALVVLPLAPATPAGAGATVARNHQYEVHAVHPDFAGAPVAGYTCALRSATDPTIENGDVQTGTLDGGPLAGVGTIEVRCTVQVGAANSTHAGADSTSADSPVGIGATEVPTTVRSYYSPDGQPVYLCTRATVSGVNHYWHGVGKTWSLSAAVPCVEAINQAFPKP